MGRKEDGIGDGRKKGRVEGWEEVGRGRGMRRRKVEWEEGGRGRGMGGRKEGGVGGLEEGG
jgi:hypothetical protein